MKFPSLLTAALAALLCLPATAATPWTPVWSTSASNAGALSLSLNQSVRTVVRVGAGGTQFRVVFSNKAGTRAIPIAEAWLGVQEAGAKLVPGSNRRLTFGGAPGAVLAVGAELASDPVALSVGGGGKLAISMHVNGTLSGASQHAIAREKTYLSISGNRAAEESARNFVDAGQLTNSAWPLLARVETTTATPPRVIVAIGDSLTDGFQSSLGVPIAEDKNGLGRDERYPDYLQQRIANERTTSAAVVLNAGISSNKVLSGSSGAEGPSLLDRLNRDVFSVPGVTDVLLLAGINDLGNNANLTADQLITGLSAAIQAMKSRGLRVVVGTLMPARGSFLGLKHGSPKTATRRAQINQWIRTTSLHDGYVDFDRCLDDPVSPGSLNLQYDSGDHVHPNAAGYKRMADCVDLDMLLS